MTRARPAARTPNTLAWCGGWVCFFGLLVLGLILSNPEDRQSLVVFIVVSSLVELIVNGWALYAFLRYREGRQEELHLVLTAAVERRLPLGQAIRSYLHDRPRLHSAREAGQVGWVVLVAISVLVAPFYWYCRLLIGPRSYDRLAATLADHLEAGESLAAALHRVHGVASREVQLAAEVGESTGALGACLAGVARERWSAAWLEITPRVLYPFFVLVFVAGIVVFLMLSIVPRFKRIFDEFGASLPVVTTTMIHAWASVVELFPLLFVVAVLAGIGLAAVATSSGVRWRTPVVGRLYKWDVQGEILRTLGRLLAAGQTVPQALGFMSKSAALPRAIRHRLARATAEVEGGEPLDHALGRTGLLPATMAPLVGSAARVGTLPWALVELGDHLTGRAFRLVRRLSLVAAPLMVIAVGLLVGFIAIAMFLPLIKLLTRLSE